VEPDRENIEDLMRRYGGEEKEAEAFYYLRKARDCFKEMYQDAGKEKAAGTGPMAVLPKLWSQTFFLSNVHPHFEALSSLLAKRVLGRDYPESWGEGWGSRPASNEEGQPD
jgi:hypothetical protein